MGNVKIDIMNGNLKLQADRTAIHTKKTPLIQNVLCGVFLCDKISDV